ncbi:MAG: hypothetical protein U1E65_19260 [Myxococcota bacterium]
MKLAPLLLAMVVADVGCAPASQLDWLDASQFSGAQSLITVFDDGTRVRRALRFDPATPLSLPDSIPSGRVAHVEVHAMAATLEDLALSEGELGLPPVGRAFPQPLLSLGEDFGRGTKRSWRPIDNTAISDLRIPAPCSHYTVERIDFPAESGGGFLAEAPIDEDSLLLSFEGGALLRFTPGRGFQRITRDWGQELVSLARTSSGTFLSAEQSGEISESKLDQSGQLIRRWHLQVPGEPSLVASIQASPADMAVILTRPSGSRDLVRVSTGSLEVMEVGFEGLIGRRGDGVYAFGQRSATLRRFGAQGLEEVATPAVSGFAAVEETPGLDFTIGTSDAVILQRDAAGTWKRYLPLDMPRPGSVVEQVLPIGDRFIADIDAIAPNLVELLPDGSFCTPLTSISRGRMHPLRGGIVQSYADGIWVLRRDP